MSSCPTVVESFQLSSPDVGGTTLELDAGKEREGWNAGKSRWRMVPLPPRLRRSFGRGRAAREEAPAGAGAGRGSL